jgi:serine/threonine protein kinase
MSLAPSTRLGPYQIVSMLGAGGMGEVYRARDTRLGRDVAVKILPPDLAQDTGRRQRFEREARAAGGLNHPHLVAVFDVGNEEGLLYLVTELVDGESLRALLRRGVPPLRQILEIGAQAADGLAAAHAGGIVHRDLKPDNIMLTRDGRAKILDFGLARQTGPAGRDETATEAGVVMGTAGYMSPEQVRGEAVDHRSDIFALGAVLYEMATGRRAFERDTSVASMYAIMHDDPAPMTGSKAPPALERIVLHCLEKSPERRFQSARDLAFHLQAVTVESTTATLPLPDAPPKSRRWLWTTAAALTVAALLAGSFFLGRTTAKPVIPKLRQITFRRGDIESARFGPDGHTIVYGAAWDGKEPQLYSARTDSSASRRLELPNTLLCSISSTGEMAMLLNRRTTFLGSVGTLARVPLAGGSPRQLIDDAQAAAWTPDGSAMAVVRISGDTTRLEFPIGTPLYQTHGWITDPAFSPQGDVIAFLDHPTPGDDAGSVAIVDRAGKKTIVSPYYESTTGLAWAPSGEIWYTASEPGAGYSRSLLAVSRSGGQRVLRRMAGYAELQDIASDGRVLIAHGYRGSGILGRTAGDPAEHDLTWLDNPIDVDLSADGKRLLIAEAAAGEGPRYGVYLRPTDGGDAIRLGDGYANALSPDGRFAAVILYGSPKQLVLMPTGAGETKILPHGPVNSYVYTNWLHDGRRVVFTGTEPGHSLRAYVQDVTGGDPRPISSELIPELSLPASPDDRWVARHLPTGGIRLFSVDGSETRDVAGGSPGEGILQFTADGKALFVANSFGSHARVFKLDVATGKREAWKDLAPADPAGVVLIHSIRITPDERGYVYVCFRVLSNLYVLN